MGLMMMEGEEEEGVQGEPPSGSPRASPGPGQIFSRAPSLMNFINLIKSLNANQRRIRGGGLGVATPPPPFI